MLLWHSPEELLLLAVAALVLDWVVGDPPWPTHPVILMGRLVHRLEAVLLRGCNDAWPQAKLHRRGILLTVVVVAASGFCAYAAVAMLTWVHPWLGLAAEAWLISTTIAVKGLKEAAMRVYGPLVRGDLPEARKYVGWIVGRDTDRLEEPEIVRAAVETVAENTVDAVAAPFLFALLGGAPFAIAYRAANTLDSMVGYKNDKYLHFGWASARLDDVLNYIPARMTALLLAAAALLPTRTAAGEQRFRFSSAKALCAVRQFARLHPSPNSGFPESAVAGALGVELGGVNTYGGIVSDRARMGWPARPLERRDLLLTVILLYRFSYLLAGGAAITWIVLKLLSAC